MQHTSVAAMRLWRFS